MLGSNICTDGNDFQNISRSVSKRKGFLVKRYKYQKFEHTTIAPVFLVKITTGICFLWRHFEEEEKKIVKNQSSSFDITLLKLSWVQF